MKDTRLIARIAIVLLEALSAGGLGGVCGTEGHHGEGMYARCIGAA